MKRAPAPPRAEDKRRHILEAARNLLVRRGFSDIVLDDVAREADVAKGTLYLYFKGKDELFAAAFEDLVVQLGEKLDVLLASGRRGRGLLEDAVRTILVHFDANRDFIAQFITGRLPGCGAGSGRLPLARFQENMGRVSRILSRCVPEAFPEPADPEYAAIAVFALCRGAMMQKLFTGSRRALASETTKVVEFFLRGAEGRR